MEENTLNNLTIQDLLRHVDRSHPEVKVLAEALEVELENNSPDGSLDEVINHKISAGGEKPRSGWRDDDEFRGG